MNRVFELAKKGLGKVAPNPMVGCVIVKDDKIIGEGWHREFGKSHAEINAIESVENRSDLAGADMYVNLEPCSHTGHTPACAPVVAGLNLKRVILSNGDPNPRVNGRGINKIREKGVEVLVGTESEKGKWLNRRFFTFQEKMRPYVILKWAQTSDGFIARENYDSKWISTDLSRKKVHRWRSEEQAIMVGHTTYKFDNPSLTVRDWKGKNPLRIVAANTLEIDKSKKIFDGSADTLIYVTNGKEEKSDTYEVKILNDEAFIQNLLSDLYSRNIISLIVEGGTKLINNFLKMNLWDEARVFTSEKKFEKGIEAPFIENKPFRKEHINNDTLRYYTNG